MVDNILFDLAESRKTCKINDSWFNKALTIPFLKEPWNNTVTIKT